MDTQINPPAKEKVVDFMLAEYSALRDLRQNLVTLGENRFNLFLGAVSGALVGLALLHQLSGGNTEIMYLVDGAIITGLFFLGLITFVRTVEREIGITVYARGMNRVRRYFVEHNQNIKDYIILPISDDRPSFQSIGFRPRGILAMGLPAMVAIINSVVAGIGALVFAKEILSLPTAWAIVIAVSIFIVISFAQNRYQATRITEMEKKTDIRFPTSK